MQEGTRQSFILIITSISIFFEALDIAIINLTMPLIQTSFGLSANTVQWLQTLYVLLYGGLLIVGGRLSDTVGRKRIFLAASGLFLLTSFGAGLSTTFNSLLAFRALQGVAAALLMPAALSIVTNTYTDTQARGRAIGVFSSFAAIGSGSGLSVGGLIASSFGWQWVFFINVPVILLCMVLAYRYIPGDRETSTSIPDLSSGLLLTLLITALSYIVHELGNWRTQGGWLVLLTAFVVLGTREFLRRNAAQPDPLIRFAVLRQSTLAIGEMLLLGAIFTSYLFLISLVLQKDRQLSAAQAGLLLLPFSVLSALTGKFLMPFLLKRLSVRRIARLGMLSMLLGTGLLLWQTQFAPDNVGLLLGSIACVNGFGIALCFSALTVLSLQPVPEAYHGLASGVGTTSYFVGGGLGLSLLSLFLSQPATGGSGIGSVPLAILGAYAAIGVLGLVGAPKVRVL
ncbi:major facilitator superfamily MFS_1 [Fibrisoma limi BUZ 3]|uniref:Major facilitator superfamily MFS_1 n=1 Tax=Fibrisoma limi BUZ 3 TaxID=1185876 RepID=I2GDK6_9BACT|nr:MFS transporter [Fibrisoma limi]CCH51980.1 major facilitator superfamily MFS_1 [Fibrisoma limi BUZ 3]